MSGSLLREAVGLHQAGRLAEAAELYRRLISVEPAHARAHYLLAAAMLADDPAAALGAIERSIALDPASADSQAVLGHALKALGRGEEAIAAYRQAVHLQPDYAEMHDNLGSALRERAKSREQMEQAAESLRRAIALKPGMVTAHNNLGLTLRQLARPAEAAEAFRAALALAPDAPELLLNLGAALLAAGQAPAAAETFARATELAPAVPEARLQLGLALREARQFAESAGILEKLDALRPDNPAVLNEWAASAMLAGRLDQSEALVRKALSLLPGNPALLNNLGYTLGHQGRFAEALEAHEAGCAAAPSVARGHVDLGKLLLASGQYVQRAWDLRERRLEQPDLAPPYPGPKWNGGALSGDGLLLYAEQGLGDSIQFSRYVSMAAKRAVVTLVVPSPLVRLMRTLPGAAAVLPSNATPPPFAAQCSLLSLPAVFGTTWDTIPAAMPYLSADPEAVEVWRDRLSHLPGRKVGLVWAGSPDYPHAHWRDIPAAALVPLLGTPGVSFVSLQKPAVAAPAGLVEHDWTEELTDMADTAALIMALDLVIGCDTSVLHLAGALGRPAWLLQRFNADWRWFPRSRDTAWYPTMRQFWQPRFGDWDTVIADVRTALT